MSPRVLLGAAVLLILVVIGVVLGIVLSGGSSKSSVPTRGSLVNALPGAADVQRQLDGVQQRGSILGSLSAPVTLIEYVDLQCPFCREFDTEVLPTLISRYIRTGKLKFETRLLAFIGADSQRGRAAAIAAGRQNKLFNFTHLLYRNQGGENTGWLNDGMVTSAAASIPGLDVPRLLDEASSAGSDRQSSAYDAQATAANVDSTPTVFVGKSGTKPQRVNLSTPTDVQSVEASLAAALR